jgi:nucleotide-binding universal stress UspA family protein
MFRKLLVPLDRSDLAEQALAPAASIARASGADIDLVVVHDPLGKVDDEVAYLAELAIELGMGAGITPTYDIVRGTPADAIVERAHEEAADLIVLTSHGRTGVSRAWMGSVADAVLRQSQIPVLVLRASAGVPAPRTPGRRVSRMLVTLDGSARSREILPAAAALAKSSDARVLLLKVVPPVPQDEIATQRLVSEARLELDAASRILTAAGVLRVEPHVLVAEQLARSILDFATHHAIEAIAMASNGRGASRLFVGSVADKVLRATTLPILIIRPVTARGPGELLDASSVAEQLPSLAYGDQDGGWAGRTVKV